MTKASSSAGFRRIVLHGSVLRNPVSALPCSLWESGVVGIPHIWRMAHQLPEQVRLAYSSAMGQDRAGGQTAMSHLAERLRGCAFDAVLSGRLVTDLSQMVEQSARKRKDLSYCGAVPTRPPKDADSSYDDPGNWTYAATGVVLV